MAENSEPFDSFLMSSNHRKLSFYYGKRNHSSSHEYHYVCIRLTTLMNTIITTPSLNFELRQLLSLSSVLFSHGRICASRREESGGVGE